MRRRRPGHGDGDPAPELTGSDQAAGASPTPAASATTSRAVRRAARTQTRSDRVDTCPARPAGRVRSTATWSPRRGRPAPAGPPGRLVGALPASIPGPPLPAARPPPGGGCAEGTEHRLRQAGLGQAAQPDRPPGVRRPPARRATAPSPRPARSQPYGLSRPTDRTSSGACGDRARAGTARTHGPLRRTGGADVPAPFRGHAPAAGRNGCHRRPGATCPSGSRRSTTGRACCASTSWLNWLRDEHGIAHGHASAIVHEYDKRRGARRHTCSVTPDEARAFVRGTHGAVLARSAATGDRSSRRSAPASTTRAGS